MIPSPLVSIPGLSTLPIIYKISYALNSIHLPYSGE